MSETTERQLLQLMQQYYSAFITRDWKEFADFLDPEFEYVTDGCVVQSKNQFVQFLAANNWKGSGFSISHEKFLLSQLNDVAILSYLIVFDGLGESPSISAVETSVLQSSNSNWRLLRCHSSNRVVTKA